MKQMLQMMPAADGWSVSLSHISLTPLSTPVIGWVLVEDDEEDTNVEPLFLDDSGEIVHSSQWLSLFPAKSIRRSTSSRPAQRSRRAKRSA